jgi:mono/diheme cytochrome c family protein
MRFVLFVLLGWYAPIGSAQTVDYARDVKPILKDRCYACHGALKQESDLRVDTATSLVKAEVVKAGKSKDSELVLRISAKDDSRMPPEGKLLTPEQIATISKWIDEGAKAPADEKPDEDPRKHWAFVEPVRPKVAGGNPIDALLDAERKARGLVANGDADRATLLRRVYIDLIGLPPTREQLHTFLNDKSPAAYEKVVDRLLASPQYGERWARHWMDVWRYSDWYGRRGVPDVLNSYGQIWRWRDWIVKAMNEDRGYDRMIRDMLAADELTPTDDANIVATGFVVRNFYRWNYNNWMRDSVEHTSKAFLGLTFNCCHCHDHKYDPISQEEYFKLRAVFEPIEIRQDRWPGEADPGVYPKYSYGAAYKPISTGMVRVVEEKLDAPTRFYSGGDERNIAKDKPPITPGVPASLGGTYEAKPVTLPAEAWYPGLKKFVRDEEMAARMKAIDAARVERSKSRLQLAQAVGRSVLSPFAIVDLELAISTNRNAEAQFASTEADLESLKARIAADDVAYLGAKGDPKATAEAANRAESRLKIAAMRANLTKAELTLATARRTKAQAGQVPAFEKQVATAKAAVATAETAAKTVSTQYAPLSHQYAKSTTGRRSALANWIANRENPLTARVAVNHVWNWHFGRPLVETTNNFGRSGKAPTHPQLLDWLAVELMENGWKFKPLHRLIVTSKAYRMASTGRAHPNDLDNVYLARFPSQRLDAECVRDGLLHVAGELDLAIGGPDIPQDQGLTSRRRSLYFTHHGEARMMFLDLFDAANPCDAYRRSAAVLPQQALALANSEFTLDLSRKLTAKLLKTDSDTTRFVTAAFEQVLARTASAAERSAAIRFLERQTKLFESDLKQLPPNLTPLRRAQESLVQALFNHTDFVTVR